MKRTRPSEIKEVKSEDMARPRGEGGREMVIGINDMKGADREYATELKVRKCKICFKRPRFPG